MEETLSANIRTKLTKGETKSLRRKGRIPGVVYGLNIPSLSVEFAEMDIMEAIHSIGEHGIISLKTGSDGERVMIKEIQREPVYNKIVHVDLQRVKENQRIHVKIPVVIRGEATIRSKGAYAQVQLDALEVETTPSKLPRYIAADISKIPVGGRLTVGDLELSEEIGIVGDPKTIIASVAYIKNNAAEEETPNEALVIHTEK